MFGFIEDAFDAVGDAASSAAHAIGHAASAAVDAVGDAASAVVDWTEDHAKTIAVIAASTVVFVGVTALTGGLGAPALLALASGGFASGATGYALSNVLDHKPVTFTGLLTAGAVSTIATIATAGLLEFASPIVGRLAAPLAAAVPEAVSNAVPAVIARTVTGAATGAGLGAGTQVVENLIAGRPVGENVGEASIEGSLNGALMEPATRLVGVPLSRLPLGGDPVETVETASVPADKAPDEVTDDPASGATLPLRNGIVQALEGDTTPCPAEDGSQCFLAGTLVVTSDGLRPIESVRPGERVLAASDQTLARSFREVSRVFRDTTPRVTYVTVATRPRPRQTGRTSRHARASAARSEATPEPPRPIRCTETHRFLVAGRGWTPAGELRRGDSLISAAGEAVAVLAVEVRAQTARTFNLEVEVDHSYFVAAEASSPAVWVHNVCKAQLTPAKRSTLEKKLATGDVSAQSQPINAGVNKTSVSDVEGTKVIVKPKSGLDMRVLRNNIPPGHDMERELAAYEVAKYMGVDMPTTVVRQTPYGVAMVQEFRNGVSGFGRDLNQLNNRDAIALFDAVIGNEDRHGGNFLVSGQNIIPIDHGLSFPRQGTTGFANEAILESRASSPLAQSQLTPQETDLLTRLQGDKPFRAKLGKILKDKDALATVYDRIAKMLSAGKVLTVREMSQP
jgi:hypothetical protein